MKRSQTPGPHHELSFDEVAPWPVPAMLSMGDVNVDPAARCCRECGRRLLLLLLRSSAWVSHRTEHVTFRDDLSVARRVSVVFHVPTTAPIFRGDDGQDYRLVPLSVMRRKTLISFELHDEDGRSVFVPSLRQSQAITESVLLACADAMLGRPNSTGTDAAAGREIADFIHQVVSGDQQALHDAYMSLDNGTADSAVLELAKRGMFRAILDRMADNSVLWVMIPAGAPRRRVLTFSYDEPLKLFYRRPGFRKNKYMRVGKLSPWHPIVWCSSLGLTATRIRFPVPAAESTSSFHFEIDAPNGVQIVEASLLAGRPMQANFSLDYVRGSFPSVALNVIDVPNVSLSRAQISLQVITRGWLMTSMLSSWVVFALLLAFATHHGNLTQAGGLPVLILAALAGQVAGFIAQSDSRGLAAYLLKRARIFATIAAVLPLATVYIAFEAVHRNHITLVLWTAVGIGGVIATILSSVCFASWRRQRFIVVSPWEQNRYRGSTSWREGNFMEAAAHYQYDKPAMLVETAEGWHTEFPSDQDEEQLVAALEWQMLYSTGGVPPSLGNKGNSQGTEERKGNGPSDPFNLGGQ